MILCAFDIILAIWGLMVISDDTTVKGEIQSTHVISKLKGPSETL